MIKILLAVVLVAGTGFFLYREFRKAPQSALPDVDAMKQSIVADPKVNAPQLTDAQKTVFLEQFKTGKNVVIQSNYDTLDGLNQVALAKQHLGDLQGAETAWLYANIIRPKNSLSFSNLGALYQFDLHEFDKAEQNYLISVANDPKDIPTIRNLFDLYHQDLKADDKAEGLLLDSIKNNPQSADLYALLGSFYAEAGKTQQAITAFQKVLSITPNNASIQQELNRLKQQGGK
jgi:tetratricopeptide (TPR) repeat protein